MSVVDTSNLVTRDPLIQGFAFEELEVGMTAYVSKTMTQHDAYTFAGITGDFNPAHVNEEVAKQMGLPGRICHGALTAGLVSTALGTRMPGAGCLYMSQKSTFTHIVEFGDTLTCKITVLEKIEEKERVIFKTEVFNQRDELVLTGEAKLKVPKKEHHL